MLWFSRFDRVQWPVQKLARLGGCDLACERQTFLLAHRRWGMFREEERTQRQKIHTDDVNQCLHSHGVPNAKLFLLAKRSSAAMSEEKRLPFAGYWGATLPPQKSDPARRINLLAEPTFFCTQLATLAYGSDNCIFYTRTNRSARLTWSLQPRLQGFSFFPRPSIWTRLTPMARQARAHNLEHATPILGLCKGVFTYQFIFSTIWQHFSPRNWKHRPVRVRIHTDRTTITLKKKK